MRNGLLLTNRVGIDSIGQRNMPEQVIKATRRSSLIIFEKWKLALDTTSWEALDEHAREVSGSFSALRLSPLEFYNKWRGAKHIAVCFSPVKPNPFEDREKATRHLL